MLERSNDANGSDEAAVGSVIEASEAPEVSKGPAAERMPDAYPAETGV